MNLTIQLTRTVILKMTVTTCLFKICDKVAKWQL